MDHSSFLILPSASNIQHMNPQVIVIGGWGDWGGVGVFSRMCQITTVLGRATAPQSDC